MYIICKQVNINNCQCQRGFKRAVKQEPSLLSPQTSGISAGKKRKLTIVSKNRSNTSYNHHVGSNNRCGRVEGQADVLATETKTQETQVDQSQILSHTQHQEYMEPSPVPYYPQMSFMKVSNSQPTFLQTGELPTRRGSRMDRPMGRLSSRQHTIISQEFCDETDDLLRDCIVEESTIYERHVEHQLVPLTGWVWEGKVKEYLGMDQANGAVVCVQELPLNENWHLMSPFLQLLHSVPPHPNILQPYQTLMHYGHQLLIYQPYTTQSLTIAPSSVGQIVEDIEQALLHLQERGLFVELITPSHIREVHGVYKLINVPLCQHYCVSVRENIQLLDQTFQEMCR